MWNNTTAGTNGSDGFISNVKSGLGEGLGTVFSQVLPVWAAKELDIQQSDQMRMPTYVHNDAYPRIDDALTFTGASPYGTADQAPLTIGGLAVSTPVLVVTGIILGGLALYAALR